MKVKCRACTKTIELSAEGLLFIHNGQFQPNDMNGNGHIRCCASGTKHYSIISEATIMNSRVSIDHLLTRISYKPNTGFSVGIMNTEAGDGHFIQHWQLLHDTSYGGRTRQYGRKIYISPYMTESEFFQSCFAAVQAFEEHEARENFQVDGLTPFGPHIHSTSRR